MIGQLLALLCGGLVIAFGLFLLATSVGLVTVGAGYGALLLGGSAMTWAVGL